MELEELLSLFDAEFGADTELEFDVEFEYEVKWESVVVLCIGCCCWDVVFSFGNSEEVFEISLLDILEKPVPLANIESMLPPVLPKDWSCVSSGFCTCLQDGD